VLFARDRDSYIDGLTAYRDGDIDGWIERFATAARRAADLADDYLRAVDGLRQRWRTMLANTANPRSDAAAWAVIDVLPAHPVVTAAVAKAATGRAKAAIHAAIDQLADAGVLLPLTGGRRNRSWEVVGLLDLIADLEAGDVPRPFSG
jgi:Fic family protein